MEISKVSSTLATIFLAVKGDYSLQCERDFSLIVQNDRLQPRQTLTHNSLFTTKG